MAPIGAGGTDPAGRTDPAGLRPDTFGGALRHLRRRARLTQRELGWAVGYSEAQICRLEQGRRLPDPTTVAALFVPALHLEPEPATARRLVELARLARAEAAEQRPDPAVSAGLEPVPPPAQVVVPRPGVARRLDELSADHRGVLVCGLPGAGKTSLVAERARAAARSGADVGWITLISGVNTSAEALVRRVALILRHGGERAVAPLLDADGADAWELDRRLGLLSRVLHRRRLLLCLDNAHLVAGDALALTVLRHLTGATPVTLLATSRLELPVPDLAVLRLRGLEAAEGRELIRALGGPADAATQAALLEHTAGSPMLLRLALGRLRADPDAGLEPVRGAAELASSLLESTLESLSPAGRRLLGLLAVLQRPVDLRDEELAELAAAAGLADALRAQGELQRCQLLDRPDRAVLHPLVREHVRGELADDPELSHRLHHVAALHLEADPTATYEAARHFADAGEPAEAAEVLAAGRAAIVRHGSADAAADLAGRLARQVAGRRRDEGPNPLVAQLLGVRGDLLVGTLRAAEAETAYRDALAEADGPVQRAEASWRLAHCRIQRGGPSEALRLCREAAEGLPETEALLSAILAAGESGALLALTRYDEAVAAADRALAAAERAERSPGVARDRVRLAQARARAHGTLGVVSRLRQQEADAAAHFERAAAAAGVAGDLRMRDSALFNLGALRLVTGDLDGASDLLTQLLPRMEAQGDGHGQGRVLHALAAIRLARDDAEAALDLLDRACEIKARMGDVNGEANSQNSRAMALTRLGRLVEARSAVERALAVPAADAESWARCYFLTTRAAIDLLTGETGAAVDGYREALRQPGIAGTDAEARATGQLALALLVAGDTTAAERILRQPQGHQDHAAMLERRFADGVLALVREDRAAARAAGLDVLRQAADGELPAYRGAAESLLEATDRPGPVAVAGVVAPLFIAPGPA